MDRLLNRRVVVTGGAAGLGSEYVRALLAEGATVAIADVDAEAGAALAATLGDRALFVATDVGDPASVQAGFDAIAARMGGIDVLVNNAGVYPHQAFEDIGLDDWDRTLRVNLSSVFYCSRAVVPHMKGDGGKIVNVATNLVWVMAPLMAHYIAAKAGVVGFTRGAARELGEHGITINALAPGANMPGDDLSPQAAARMREIIGYQAIKRPQMHHDLLGAVIFLCCDDSDFMTGQVVCVDGGIAVP